MQVTKRHKLRLSEDTDTYNHQSTDLVKVLRHYNMGGEGKICGNMYVRNAKVETCLPNVESAKPAYFAGFLALGFGAGAAICGGVFSMRRSTSSVLGRAGSDLDFLTDLFMIGV